MLSASVLKKCCFIMARYMDRHIILSKIIFERTLRVELLLKNHKVKAVFKGRPVTVTVSKRPIGTL